MALFITGPMALIAALMLHASQRDSSDFRKSSLQYLVMIRLIRKDNNATPGLTSDSLTWYNLLHIMRNNDS